jgi:hypothetical protein
MVVTGTATRSAITPGESHRNALDYADQADAKFYKMMITSPTIKFDGKGENLRAFMERITERVDEGGMHGVFNVPEVITGAPRDFLRHYGIISLDDCRLVIQRHYNVGQRDAQDNHILFTYLTNYLTPEFEREIKAQPARYSIHASGGTYRSGLLFLKVILSRAQTDTMATVEVLRRKVQSLSSKIIEMQGNIVEFHTYIKGLQNDFAAYNVTCNV